MNEKNFKDKYRKKFSKKYKKFYPAETLEQMGYSRGKCEKCGRYFWSTDPERKVCGDSACSGGYKFINDTPAKREFSYTGMWEEFSRILSKEGYTPIKRYPVAARWRKDIYFVEASIDDFIPYVVSGEIDPPENPLVVPQTCLRFNDLDNIGFTGAHYSLFNMIGQHGFYKEGYQPGVYLKHLYKWFDKGLGLDKEEIIFHEDFWSGSGNFGPCIEIFSRGLELANQVYMQYTRTNSGYKDLNLKVLDMGLGQERNAWFSKGKSNSYEAVFPEICNFLRRKTGVRTDSSVIENFLPYSSHLNLDEVESAEKAWRNVAEDSGVEVERLEREVKPLAALYAIGDHTRALLIALSDGILPSNTGGGYNLRVLIRRCRDFIEKYGWGVDLISVVEKHAQQLKEQYPETQENLEDVSEILKHEIRKYKKTREKTERIVVDLDTEKISEEKILELYDSQGISPELLEANGVEIPENFYAKVAERHIEESKENKEVEEIEFDIESLSKTVPLYRDEFLTNFKAKVLRYENNWLILDETAFYPTSGGQHYDKGSIENNEVEEVRKKDGVILHKVEGDFEEGEEVRGEIDWDRREQLMQHHTATHIINGVCRRIYGNHIWQAGAEKTTEKARLDVTHYKNIGKEEIQKIEDKANEIISEDLSVEKKEIPREEAEEKYGFRIYQGGAVPGKMIRIVNIQGLDVEACGGTHCDYTSDVEKMIITGTKKIQDGVVRIEFKAGNAAEEFLRKREEIEASIGRFIDTSKGLEEIAEVFSTEIEELPNVVKRFIKEWKEKKARLKELEGKVGEKLSDKYEKRPPKPEELFKSWKDLRKDIDSLEEDYQGLKIEEFSQDDRTMIIDSLDLEVGDLIRISREVTKRNPKKAVVLKGKNAMIGSSGPENEYNVKEEIEKYAEKVQGNENFAKGFKLKENL